MNPQESLFFLLFDTVTDVFRLVLIRERAGFEAPFPRRTRRFLPIPLRVLIADRPETYD